jgi:hypothetical protein
MAPTSRATARPRRTGSDGPVRRRLALLRRDGDRLLEPVERLDERVVERDPRERVLGRGRVGVRVATWAG